MRRFPRSTDQLFGLLTLGLTIALLSAVPAQADVLAAVRQILDAPNQTPHPSVAQVIVREKDGIASGSGTLIHVDAEHGYLLTNWHVVRSAEPPHLQVNFPDGFQTPATVVMTDDIWDLALLKMWRPHVAPMPMSSTVPVVGEELVIAGYGQDKYRAARGRCRYYAAPNANSPQDMIEVSVAARQGDSGGPIMNQRGELAAVLFGSGHGMTTGTHVGRVVHFLNNALTQPASRLARVPATDIPRPTSLTTADAKQPDSHQPDGSGVVAAHESQYYKLPPLEWTDPPPEADLSVDNLAGGVPVFPGEQSPQPAVTAQLSTVSPVGIVVDSLATDPPANPRSPAAAAAGSPPATRSITAIDPRPPAGLLSTFDSVPANAAGSRTSQPAASAPGVPATQTEPSRVVTNAEEIITLPDLSDAPLLHHLKSLLAVIGLVALLERLRK